MVFLALAALAMSGPLPEPVEGDTVVAFEVVGRGSKDSDVYVQRLSRSEGKPLWGGGKPIAVGASVSIESNPAICDDDQGGVYVAFEYTFVDGEHAGDTDIVIVRLDKNGNLVWGAEPKQVAGSASPETRPLLLRDGRGGVLVVYEWRDGQGDVDLLAQHVGPDGTRLWNGGGEPVEVAASPNPETAASIVSDGQGGLIACFEWVGASGNADVMAQRLSAEGVPLWHQDDQARDVAASNHLERHVSAVSDGKGGVIAAYEIEFVDGEYKGDVDIHAQHLSSDGKPMWPEETVVSSSDGIERRPSAVSDSHGGIAVAFELEPTSGEHKGDIDVLAQRLGPDGKMLWENGERSVAASTSEQLERYPRIVPDGRGGFVMACEVEFLSGETKGDIDVLAQRIKADGSMAWNEGKRSIGVSTSKWNETRPLVLSDGQGGAVIVFSASMTAGEHAGDSDIEAMHVSITGVLEWLRENRSADVASSDDIERNPSAVVVGAWRWID